MYLLIIVVLILLLLNYIQTTEIKKLKALFTYDQDKMIEDSKEYLMTMNEIQTIKKIRTQYYPIDLIQAKKVVDKANSIIKSWYFINNFLNADFWIFSISSRSFSLANSSVIIFVVLTSTSHCLTNNLLFNSKILSPNRISFYLRLFFNAITNAQIENSTATTPYKRFFNVTDRVLNKQLDVINRIQLLIFAFFIV